MRSSMLSSLALGSWLSSTALATLTLHDASFTPDHILRVTVENINTGCQSRQDVVVNGTKPGPALHILPDATTWVRVYNDMTDANLTMHWHGLAQRMAPFADGTPQASQWPIPPGHFFDYEIVTDKGDAGSYFYHSHVLMQEMSCAGPLIVDDCGQSPYHYDDDRILMFQDYFSDTNAQMEADVTGVPFKWPGDTNGILLNGIGVSSGKTAVATREAGPRSRRFGPRKMGPRDSSSQCTLPVIDVDPGKTYRFRFIGGTGLSFVAVAFEDHSNLTIVQVDGAEYNKPVSTSHLQFGAGQRFDVIFQTKTAAELQALGNKETFYIQFQSLDPDGPNPFVGYGALRYSQQTQIPAAPSNPVISLPTDAPHDWMEYTFTPLYPDQNKFPDASEVTRRVVINCTEKSVDGGKIEIQLNGLSWTEHSYTSPMLVDIYNRGQAAIPDYDAAIRNGGWDPNTMSYPAKIGEVLEIIFQNTASAADGGAGHIETHPFHAHSKHYYDIGSGQGVYDADANNAKIKQLGYKPVKRDTTMLFRYNATGTPGEIVGWRGWRVRAEDAGVWMVHCHILAHMMMGMQSVWVVGGADDIKSIPMEESAGYLTYGGDVFGNNTHNPSYFEYSDYATHQCEPVKQSKRDANLFGSLL